MENYVVRIYRRDATDPHKVVGIFESVERETEDTFTHLKTLVSLLATKGTECESVADVEQSLKRVRERLKG